MTRVFLAGPFKALVDHQTGEVVASFKQRLMRLMGFFEDQGCSVHNAHKREAWGSRMMTPEECTLIDFEEIRSCDWFVALPGHPASPGTHIEIGWASALGKRIVLLLEADKDYAFLVRGLHRVAHVQYIHFETDEECLEKLQELFQTSL